MKVALYLNARDGGYNAKATYDGAKVAVLKGSKIRLSFANHVRGGKTAKKYRDNPLFVDTNGFTLDDCVFESPSTAAQFVMGSSVNGWTAWHIDKKTTLKKYVEEISSDNT